MVTREALEAELKRFEQAVDGLSPRAERGAAEKIYAANLRAEILKLRNSRDVSKAYGPADKKQDSENAQFKARLDRLVEMLENK